MRIKELLESQHFNDSEFLDEKYELAFDLAEDLSFFMNNDDDTYRRHVYPSIVKCLRVLEQKKQPNPMMFKTAALESYKNYTKKYPIRQLPESLDDELIKEVCKNFYEEICKHVKEGKFKD